MRDGLLIITCALTRALRARDGGRRAALAQALALALVAAACSGPQGPSDEAIARYANPRGAGAAPASDAAAGPGNPTRPGADAGADPSLASTASPARRVSVTVDKATGVPDLDPGPGTSDPYVVLAYEGQRFKSSVVEGSEAPVWGDSTVIDVRPGGVLEVTLFDEDSLSSDEKVGVQTVPLPPLAEGETRTLEVAYKAGKGGVVSLTLTGLARP